MRKINEPPQVTEESPLTGSCPAESDVATPASGSPDGLVGRLEYLKLSRADIGEHEHGDPPFYEAKVVQELVGALRALEAERDALKHDLERSIRAHTADLTTLGERG